jgi:hypothetical protein
MSSECVASIVHQAIDVAQVDELWPIEIWRQIEAFRDVMRKRRVVLVDDRDRRIVEFLRAALRLGVDRERKRPDDQSEQNVVMYETAQLLGP